MQTFFSVDDLPYRAMHVATVGPTDDLDENLVERLGHLVEPAKIEQEDGSVSYFDLQPY